MHPAIPLLLVWIPVVVLFALKENDKKSRVVGLAFYAYSLVYIIFVFFYLSGYGALS